MLEKCHFRPVLNASPRTDNVLGTQLLFFVAGAVFVMPAEEFPLTFQVLMV
jgi:hypothetical protein